MTPLHFTLQFTRLRLCEFGIFIEIFILFIRVIQQPIVFIEFLYSTFLLRCLLQHIILLVYLLIARLISTYAFAFVFGQQFFQFSQLFVCLFRQLFEIVQSVFIVFLIFGGLRKVGQFLIHGFFHGRYIGVDVIVI